MAEERRVVAERRTQALRGPGAGGFTPAQSVAAANPCLNCGTNIQLAFCPECGQKEIDSDPTLREFVHELAQEMLNWDGKVARTFRLLLTKPGFLTEEYLAGKRVRYITPLRLYLACSVMFFFFAAVIPRRPPDLQVNQIGDTSRDSAGRAAFARLAQTDNVVLRRLGQNMPRATDNRIQTFEAMFAAIPKAMFILLPAFAGLMALAFRDRRRRFPQHLAFSLHAHAVLYTALTALLVRRVIPVSGIRSATAAIVGATMVVYVLLAARRVYGGAYRSVLARLIVVFTSYAVAFLIVMGGAYFVIVLTM